MAMAKARPRASGLRREGHRPRTRVPAPGAVWRIGQRFALVPEAAVYRTSVRIDYSEGSQMFHLGIGFLY